MLDLHLNFTFNSFPVTCSKYRLRVTPFTAAWMLKPKRSIYDCEFGILQLKNLYLSNAAVQNCLTFSKRLSLSRLILVQAGQLGRDIFRRPNT